MTTRGNIGSGGWLKRAGWRLVVLLVLPVLLVGAVFLSGCRQSADTAAIVQLAPAAMLDALRASEIDAFVSWEPFGASAVTEGTGDYLVQSSEIWKDHPCCVLAIRTEAGQSGWVPSLLVAHVLSTQVLNDPAAQTRVRELASEFTGASPEVVDEALLHVRYSASLPASGLQSFEDRLASLELIGMPGADGKAAATADFWNQFLAPGALSLVETQLSADPSWTPPAPPIGTRVRVGYISKDLHHLPLYVAQKEGFLAKTGLIAGENLELRPYTNGVVIMQAFQNNEIDAAYLGAAPALLKAINDSVPISVVAGVNVEGSAVVAKCGAGISSPADLAGKRVAVPQVGTVQYVLLRELLDQYHIPSRVQ